MALPTVTVDEKTILLGNVFVGTDLLTLFDDDGDEITQLRIRDNNSSVDSSFMLFNGVVLSPNVLHTVDATQLNNLVLNSGTSIQANNYDFQAFSNGQWGPVTNEFIYSVVQNENKPIISASDITVVQSESVLLADFIGAHDPDGFPLKRWRIFDGNDGPTSAKIIVDGIGELAPFQWHYLWPEEFQTARFIAAQAAPNNDPIYLRVFDRNEGQGAEGFGLWSNPVSINAFTTLNINRPVGIPSEFNIATDETVAITELFQWTDADGNSLKDVRFFDTTSHSWSGSLTEFGIPIQGGQWVQFSADELANVEWASASRSFNEQVRFQVFDGNHWSDVETFRVRTNEKPIIAVAEDYSIRQQLEFVDISNLILKLDDGPVFTKYEILDASTDENSGNFRMGASVLQPGVVHEVSNLDFFDLDFKSGVYEQRSLDELYVRAFNGTFWSDWTRHTVRTEPEYLDALTGLGSWFNFRPTPLTMTFSFMQDYPTYGGGPPANEFHQVWSEARDGIREVFKRFGQILNVNFEEVPDSVSSPFGLGGDIRIGSYCIEDDPTVAFAYAPGPAEINGDIWLNRWHMGGPTDPPPPNEPCPAAPFFNQWRPGESNYEVFGHELGHAMGLKHTFEADGNNDPPFLPEEATENNLFSMMSYQQGGPYNHKGPQIYDIAALQSIYGPNTTFNNGNTVYDRDYMASTPFFGEGTPTLNVLESIWDSGGWDAIDASEEINPALIDLRPGGFSNVGFGGNISVSFGTVLEEARGTEFGDQLIGNESVNLLLGNGGNDVLEGYGGDDTLTGGAGNDTYIYKMFDGDDTINEGFSAGRDTIEIGLFLELNDFATDVRLSRFNFDMIIDFTIDDSISRGSITIEGQGFGANRVETLDFLGTDVDLRYAFDQITSPGQAFQIDFGNPQQYGFGVTPVSA